MSIVSADVTLFRHATPQWPGGPMVHILDRHESFVLVAPSPCQTVLAEILAETAAVDRDTIRRHHGAELTRRGYCRPCMVTLA